MSPEAQALYAVIGEVRSCFNVLKRQADEMHRDLGVTASMRAVLESVARTGGATVPQIARMKAVTRQHIQVNVDALAANGLVAATNNPAHRRSPLIVTTASGQAAFEEIRRREEGVLERLALGLSRDVLAETAGTLRSIRERLGRPSDDAT